MVGCVSIFLLVYYIEISAINLGYLPYASATSGPVQASAPGVFEADLGEACERVVRSCDGNTYIWLKLG